MKFWGKSAQLSTCVLPILSPKCRTLKFSPRFLGVSNQTCHKILSVIIRLKNPIMEGHNSIPSHKRCRLPSHQEQEELVLSVCKKVISLLDSESAVGTPDYHTMKNLFTDIKLRKLGIRRR